MFTMSKFMPKTSVRRHKFLLLHKRFKRKKMTADENGVYYGDFERKILIMTALKHFNRKSMLC